MARKSGRSDITEPGGDDAVRKQATIEKSVFDPPSLQALDDAFKSIVAELLADATLHTDPQSTCELIAKKVMEAAREGERDPERLKGRALKALRH